MVTGVIDTGKIEPYSYENLRDISLSFDFSKIPYEEYWQFMEKIYTKEHLKIMKNEDFLYTIRLMTSTHCPRKCIFCSSTNFLDNSCINQQRIALNAEDIYQMTKNALKHHPKCRAVYFNDDDFLFNKQRIIKLCSLLKNIKGISYFCLSRVDNVDDKLLKSMRNAGFKFIIYGVESFSNKVLNDMHKKLQTKNQRELSKNVIKKTIDIGITPLMNIILFSLTTTIKDIIDTIETCIELIDYGARITVYTFIEVYPGSNILNNGSLDYIHKEFKVAGKKFKLPDLILPYSKEIRRLAEKSIKLREQLIKDVLKKYKWKGVTPHPLYGLALFLAIYKILDIDTSKIENSIDKMMVQESRFSPIYKANKRCMLNANT